MTRGVPSSDFICTNPKHNHGSGCYRHCGCKCRKCLDSNNNYRKRYQRERNMLEGRNVWMPSWPSRDRLRALAVIGWSPTELAALTGMHRRTIEIIRRGERPAVRRSNHRLIAKFYKELSMNPAPDSRSARQARYFAEAQGWLSPMELSYGEGLMPK